MTWIMYQNNYNIENCDPTVFNQKKFCEQKTIEGFKIFEIFIRTIDITFFNKKTSNINVYTYLQFNWLITINSGATLAKCINQFD